ncbi:hypothetical protein AURDEDRAFT_112671 [Auricularia subglabra TFB-10046 SS5]|nr:hypothetical protein AURDEDRAFT_112671 [Auricularia subglabra TFB-10046 SS5]
MSALFPVPPKAVAALAISFVLALIVLGLALAPGDLGSASLYLNPLLCGSTLLHHLALFTISIRSFDFARPTPRTLPAFWAHAAHIAFLLVLGLTWLSVSLALSLTGSLSRPRFVFGERKDEFAIAGTAVAQSVLGVIESLALSGLASMCFSSRLDALPATSDADSGRVRLTPPPVPIIITVAEVSEEKPLPAAPATVSRKSRRLTAWDYLTSFAPPMRPRSMRKPAPVPDEAAV